MKTLALVLALVLALKLLAGCATPPLPVGPRCDGLFVVRNAAPQAVEQFYVSGTAPERWGADLLAPGTLSPGAAASVPRVSGPQGVRVVFVDGSAIEMQGLDTCTTRELLIGAQRLEPRS